MPAVPVPMNRMPRRYFRLKHLRQLRGSEQVAAVCYRIRKSGIEFLLVRTSGGRWIFPKGSAEPGLTHAQAAALEAHEEAGVHGRIEETPFTRYTRPRRGSKAGAVETVVNVHLCEVLWLDAAPEQGRDPTWFPLEKAKRRLQQDRPPKFGSILAGVIDHAVERIQRMHARVPDGRMALRTSGKPTY